MALMQSRDVTRSNILNCQLFSYFFLNDFQRAIVGIGILFGLADISPTIAVSLVSFRPNG